jgi:hypothetical protein
MDAVARAKALGEAPDSNPSTAVWRVVEDAVVAEARTSDGDAAVDTTVSKPTKD